MHHRLVIFREPHLRKTIPLFLIPLLLLCVLPSLPHEVIAASSHGWLSANSYPDRIDEQSCVTHSGYVYCVGGYDGRSYLNSVYYASLSSSGIGAWDRTTSYPTELVGQSCVAYSRHVYCVGGFNGTSFTDAVYYAKISSAGAGAWKQTSSYPFAPYDLACVAYSGYMYCVGGHASSSYYAPISGSGVGPWMQTTDYPFAVYSQSCVVVPARIYCVGGLDSNNTRTDPVYYASVSSSGIGAWTATTPYPTDIGEGSCVAYSGHAYCVGGSTNSSPFGINSVYDSRLRSSGAGSWSATSRYPVKIAIESCVASAGYVYCVGGSSGGATNLAYYKAVP